MRHAVNILALSAGILLFSGCAKEKGPIQPASLDFEITSGNNSNAPALVTFTNKSKFVNGFTWYFGDGDTSTALSPSHTYTSPGTYEVKLKGFTDAGIKYVTKTVTVFDRKMPVALFDYDMPKPFAGYATATFTNKSLNAVSYKWYFGDGDSSTAENPTHSFGVSRTGYFAVKLIAYSSLGDTNSITKIIKVKSQADSMDISRIVLNNAPTQNFSGGPLDTASDPDYVIVIMNFFDTTQYRTNVIYNRKDFPLNYNLASNPFKLIIPTNGFSFSVNINDDDNGVNENVSYISFNPKDYMTGSNGYPDSITISSTYDVGNVTLYLKWR